MKNPNSLTPRKLRLILSAALGLTLILGVGLFYLAYGKLDAVAREAGQQVVESQSSQDLIQKLRRLRSELESKQDAIDRTARIVADSQNYSYQDQLINDLTTYANRAGLEISIITFADSQGSTGTTAAASSSAPAATPTPAGLKTASVAVTLRNPVNYRSLLNFFHYIEQNLTKLKINKVTISKSTGDDVTTDILNLEVYVR